MNGLLAEVLMQGDRENLYQPLPEHDTPFAASLGDRAPSFSGAYGSQGSSAYSGGHSPWRHDDDDIDRIGSPEVPLPSGNINQSAAPIVERSLLKPALRKSGKHLQQRESRARCSSKLFAGLFV